MAEIDSVIEAIAREEIELLKWFGFSLDEAAGGVAEVTLSLATHHLNASGVVHDGVIFSLADHAFAMCATTVLGPAATADADIKFLASGKLGDVIMARATVTYQRSRMALIDVEVHAGETLLALYRGRASATQSRRSEFAREGIAD